MSGNSLPGRRLGESSLQTSGKPGVCVVEFTKCYWRLFFGEGEGSYPLWDNDRCCRVHVPDVGRTAPYVPSVMGLYAHYHRVRINLVRRLSSGAASLQRSLGVGGFRLHQPPL